MLFTNQYDTINLVPLCRESVQLYFNTMNFELGMTKCKFPTVWFCDFWKGLRLFAQIEIAFIKSGDERAIICQAFIFGIIIDPESCKFKCLG